MCGVCKREWERMRDWRDTKSKIKTLKYALIQSLRPGSVCRENRVGHKGPPLPQTHAIAAAPDGSTKSCRAPPTPTRPVKPPPRTQPGGGPPRMGQELGEFPLSCPPFLSLAFISCPSDQWQITPLFRLYFLHTHSHCMAIWCVCVRDWGGSSSGVNWERGQENKVQKSF